MAKKKTEVKCPDCGKRFATPQGLGAHRFRAHGYTNPRKRDQKRKKKTAAAGLEKVLLSVEGQQNKTALKRGIVAAINVLLSTLVESD